MFNYLKILKFNQKCKKNTKQKWNIGIQYLNGLQYFLCIFYAKKNGRTKFTKKIKLKCNQK